MYGRGKRKKRPRQVYSPAEDSASEEDNISDTENNTCYSLTTTCKIHKANLLPVAFSHLHNIQTSKKVNYNNTAAAAPSVSDRSIIPLLPVNSTVADAARILATSYTQLLPDNRNALPTGVLSHSPSLSPAHRTSPLAHVNR
ncbi:hypothetical protein OUZ56_000980 [Daphnia magna]|uniref:Uncharacterized protein n=1 Tax=Daphnia magna TaxID=35525 RepID=A0ABR0A1D0_9CRUS|nr:hypothetical protein OUZ56_000980 [Daphnia magna]